MSRTEPPGVDSGLDSDPGAGVLADRPRSASPAPAPRHPDRQPDGSPGGGSPGGGDRSLAALLRRLAPADRELAGWWLVSRLGFLAVLLTAPAVFAGLTDAAGSTPSLADALTRWDAVHFQAIAAHGYTPGVPGDEQPTGVPLEAFFPGFPALLALFHLVGFPYALTGVLSGLVFGGAAAWALARLATLEPGVDAARDPGVGVRAALLWTAAPLAVFVAVPYSEAPFLGLAFPAWLAARRHRWGTACLLAAGASLFRISGVYLALALLVQFLVVQLGDRSSLPDDPSEGRSDDATEHLTENPAATAARVRRDWRLLPLFVVPVLPVLAYFGYLWQASGNYRLWFDVQALVWYRTFTPPWTSLATTWTNAFDGRQSPDYAWMFGAELVAFAVGVVLTVVLLRRRRWAEAVFVGAQLASYCTSYWLMSVPRATLTWWPLWTMAAVALARRPWLQRSWFVVSISLAAVWTAAYLRSQWAG